MFFRKHKHPDETSARTRSPVFLKNKEPIYTYHSSRLPNSPERERDIPEQQHASSGAGKRFHNAAIIVLTALLLVLWVQLDGSPRLVILNSSTSDQAVLHSDSVYQHAATVLFSNFFNQNRLTVNTINIASALQRQFPELEAVAVSLPLIGNRPVITILPGVPQLIFIAQNGGTYFLDSNGRALSMVTKAAHLNSLHIPTVNDQSGLPVVLGKIVLPQSTIEFISDITGQLQAKGMIFSSIVIPPGTTELQAKVNGEGYAVEFDVQGDAREEAGTFLAVKHYLTIHNIVPNSYIDVRVPDKAFYK